MEEEETRNYTEPCGLCSEINWGITDEGKFYCKSCHNVIERIKEVDDSSAQFAANSKSQSISRGLRKRKTPDKGWEWYICEGFQYILLKQAEALQTIVGCPQLKDEILCNFWRRYLQKSNQAYTKKPYHRINRKAAIDSSTSGSEWETELEDLLLGGSSVSENEGVVNSDSSLGQFSLLSQTSASGSTKSCHSGSMDGSVYSNVKRRGTLLMSMPMTLAFCYMSLLWLRESITLSDLLRFAEDGHIPYMNCFQYFPEEMKLYGPDIQIFHVQSLPSYSAVKKNMFQLAAFLDLPRFPPITESCFLHPNLLCIKYLLEANLPDELHDWTCRVVKKTGIGEVAFLTFDPVAKSAHRVSYEIQAAAVIIVTLKLLFLLNDKYEWRSLELQRHTILLLQPDWRMRMISHQLPATSIKVIRSLADFVEERNRENEEGTQWFDFKKWYKTIKKTMDEAQEKKAEDAARYIWKSEKPLFSSLKTKWHSYKKRRK